MTISRQLATSLTFTALFCAATIVSILLHEFGHCVFYWVQGIPAAMSLVKEFPLRDITALEYAIGSTGGPAASLVLLGISLWLFQGLKNDSKWRMAISALVLANVFYFLFRGLISLLKRRGGELGDVASLVGLGYGSIVVLYAAISVGSLLCWIKLAEIRLSAGKVASFVALLVGYLIMAVGLESIDQRLFWHRFPTIQIDDGRVYNERRA